MHVVLRDKTLIIDLDSEEETDLLGRALAGTIHPNTVIGLVGPLGAGKTRLTRSIATALGVESEAISSPTYVLIHEYEGQLPVLHFDAYRLGGPEPFEALGVAEYWEAGGVCLVEWANLVSEILPESTWYVTIEPISESSRRVTITGPDPEILVALLKQHDEQG